MKIEYEGRVYDYDLDDLDVKQAMKIEQHVGGTLLDWQNGLANASTLCVQALGWVLLHDGDLTIPIDSVNFKPVKLARAWGEAAEREAAAAEGEPDPTTPAGGSTPGTPASTPSPTGQPGSPGPPAASTTVSGPTG